MALNFRIRIKYRAVALHLLDDQPLGHLCTLEVGGKARHFTRAESESDVEEAALYAEQHGLPLTILGGGSNVVIHDDTVPGLVLAIGLLGKRVTQQGSQVEVVVAAGESWDAFVAFTVAQNWAGLECLSGIPGTVGATPIQNVGAYGQEVSHTIVRVRAYDRQEHRWVTLGSAECEFTYRNSVFKSTRAGRYIVVEVSYRLLLGGAPSIRYEELSRALAQGGAPSLAQVRDTVIRLRRAKSMVIEAGDANRRSCGSFFLNPVISAEQLQHVRGVATPAAPPAFPQTDGRFKVPAAWLIEHAGFSKGQRQGAVGLSSKHALALVCHEGARARDVVAFAHRVRDTVRDRFGVKLTPEPVFLGFDRYDDGLPLLP